MSKLPLIPVDEWSEDMRITSGKMLPPRDKRPPDDGKPRPRGVQVLEVFANNQALSDAFFAFNRHVLWGTSLPPRWRHFLIIRVAAVRRSQYVWAQHVFQARDAGLTDEEMSRIAIGPDAPFFTPFEAALVRSVDEFVDDGHIADETWAMLTEELDEAQMLDVMFTIGCYVTVGAMTKSVGLEIDPGLGDMLAEW